MKKSLIVLMVLMLAFTCLFAGCSGGSEEPVATPKTALTPDEPAAPSNKIDIPVNSGREYREMEFGRFPSEEVDDEELIKSLNALADTERDSTTGYYTYDGKQYQKEFVIEKDPETKTDITVIYWFEVNPISWYVLDESDGKIMLIAKKNIDARKFNETLENTNWGISTLRDWLNGMGTYKGETPSFYNSAFTAEEQSIIVTQDITTGANPKYGTAGGDAVKDRVTILSIEDLDQSSSWSEKAFAPGKDDDVSLRACGNTDYALFKGAADEVSYALRSSSWQWLRNMGSYEQNAAYISESGHTMNAGYVVTFNQIGVRPVIVLNADYVTEK